MKKAILMTPVILYTVILCLAGYLLYVLSGLVRSLAFLLMLLPRSAKNELREAFLVHRSIGD